MSRRPKHACDACSRPVQAAGEAYWCWKGHVYCPSCAEGGACVICGGTELVRRPRPRTPIGGRPRRDLVEAWHALHTESKSFAVELLQFFHYRRNKLPNSWEQEEVLTWELYQALRVLPRHLFLRRILEGVSGLGPGFRAAVDPLLPAPYRVRIKAHPPLRAKHNDSSDLSMGLGVRTGALRESLDCEDRLLFEVKTWRDPGKGEMAKLGIQLDEQRQALAELVPDRPTAVVPLLPSGSSFPGPWLPWSVPLDALRATILELHGDADAVPVLSGYRVIAEELERRISRHDPPLVSAPAQDVRPH